MVVPIPSFGVGKGSRDGAPSAERFKALDVGRCRFSQLRNKDGSPCYVEMERNRLNLEVNDSKNGRAQQPAAWRKRRVLGPSPPPPRTGPDHCFTDQSENCGRLFSLSLPLRPLHRRQHTSEMRSPHRGFRGRSRGSSTVCLLTPRRASGPPENLIKIVSCWPRTRGENPVDSQHASLISGGRGFAAFTAALSTAEG